jgi:hypothetical protein
MVVVRVASALSVRHEYFQWGWDAAARVARTLGDGAAVDALLDDLDAHPVGHLPPLLRSERDLARARRAGDAESPDAAAMFTAAVASARRFGSPYHLAHGLLDQAEFLLSRDDTDAAGTAAPLIAEVAAIAERLGAAPLSARADRLGRPVGAPIGPTG